MNQIMPCGLEDDRLWDQAESIDEDEELLTPMEKRLSWLFDEWADALTNDSYDTWRDMRMMVYGATQALNYCTDRFEDAKALHLLGKIAFEYSLECIRSVKEAA